MTRDSKVRYTYACSQGYTVRLNGRPCMVALASIVPGCAWAGAPSFELFGAFFPAWMLCALAGILGAAGARAILVSPRFLGVVPYLLLVCTSIGVIVGLLVWRILLR